MAFIQPISMQCTYNQFEKDIKQPLIQMGYQIGVLFCYNDSSNHYICNNQNSNLGRVANISDKYCQANRRYLIREYNPALFLALAAMTDFQYGISGEWWMCIQEDSSFTEGMLYKAATSIDKTEALYREDGIQDGLHPKNLEYFRKATFEEILIHYALYSTESFLITRTGLEKIYNVACTGWKERILQYTKVYIPPFQNKGQIPYKVVQAMFMAISNSKQKEVLHSVFPSYTNDRNALTKLKPNFVETISDEFFGDSSTLQIASLGNNHALSRLHDKALYFGSKVELEVYNHDDGGTILEIKYRNS